MGKEVLTLGDIEIEKITFTERPESPVSLRNVDNENVLVSNKILFSEKNYK